MNVHLHHIAVLTHGLSAVEESLPAELERLGVDVFPSEGTKEQYIDLSASGRPSLLLIESIGDGPYRNALQKRGAGLHHIGFVTDHIGNAVDYFAQQRLLLHPITLKTVAQGVIWMCRPEIPFLVELVDVAGSEVLQPTRISLAIPQLRVDHIDWLPDMSLSRSDNSSIWISTGSVSFHITP
ncbi:MAG: hypothetical protein HC822_12830 [Oscillochloris sp.]|nr:hypothetical protein [Oscillochloris sp.]